jgi:Predicted periplasmic lipoprotein (DUF2279)
MAARGIILGLIGAMSCAPFAFAETADWKIIVEPVAYVPPVESGLAYQLRRIDTPGFQNYSVGRFVEQTSDVWIDVAGLAALNIYYGTSSDDWGSKKFHFENEGWFGKDTYALGMDKLGHAYGTYLYADYLTQRIAHSGGESAGAGITGAVLGFGLQSIVEVLDAYSSDFGFSKEDLIADGVGAGFSMLRSSIPGLSEKLDFRMEYDPWTNGSSEFSPFNDYRSQKYLLALKLSGFEQFQDTPLRFVELQAGYFARGFGPKGQAPIGELRREPYFAIGVNLSELLNGSSVRDTLPAAVARRSFEYFQVPYTYAATTQK